MIINDKCPKHTKWNPTFPPGVSRPMLRANFLKDCWARRNFKMLPLAKINKRVLKTKTFYTMEKPAYGSSDRAWAQYVFVCTFGMYTDDVFVARKYLEYMAAYDACTFEDQRDQEGQEPIEIFGDEIHDEETETDNKLK